ncbi:protein containing DUF790, endonuclease-like protein [Candidatus Magnetomorum sp. HK-1]|nr:protein containing DUF790, endonuclease-like protein [Candidatus Magnetomorum sp. HK-1]
MLTKNLVRYRIRKKQIKPQFIKTNDKSLLNTASQLLELFNESIDKTRGELLSESKIITEHSKCNSIITHGLEKLLLDRTKFNTDTPEELVNFRQELFSFTAELHNNGEIQDLEMYYQTIAKQFQKDISEIQNQLYSDLPLNQTVSKFKPISPERLLHRYNCAQVQGLLIHCEHLTLKIFNPDPACLRQLFKYLRFHQLLAQITQLNDKSGFKITIDGPLSLFFQTQKYGMNLALFFPAILHQKEWSLTAKIQFKNRNEPFQLDLDHNCKILSHYQHFMAYIPEEVHHFQKSFAKKISSWEIKHSDSLISLPGDAYCFPDYTLQSEKGIKIDLELFHAWHSTPLIYRLKQLEQTEKPILILGVCKKLLKDPAIANYVDNSNYFKHFGFLFREMPTATSIKSVLDSLPENHQG